MADETRTPQFGEEPHELGPIVPTQGGSSRDLFPLAPENRLPIHPPCGHRLLSPGCRSHHRGLGEPEPHLPTVTVMGHSLPAETVQGMLADGTLELMPDSEDLQFRLTAKGKRRAEGLLGLPAGSLDNTEDG